MMKKETWKTVIQIIVSILTAIATTLGVTSCMGYKKRGAPDQHREWSGAFSSSTK